MARTPLDYRFTLGDTSWDLDFHSITVDESIELCKVTGRKWVPLVADFDQRDALAVKAFFWLARTKAGERLAFDAPVMNFAWRDFEVRVIPHPQPEDDTAEQSPAPSAVQDPTVASPTTSPPK